MEHAVEEEDERGRGEERVKDVIGDLDAVHKRVMRLWTDKIRGLTGDRYPLSYQKYRVLKAVGAGHRFSYDIYEHANVVNSTVQLMLDDLYNRGWLTRECPDKRTYLWGLSKNGASMLVKLDKTVAELEKSVILEVKNLEEWVA